MEPIVKPIVKWVDSGAIEEPVLKNWLAMYETSTSHELISNVRTEVRCISVSDKWFFPVTINNTEWQNSYVVSPYNSYISYGEEELKRKVSNKLVVLGLQPVIRLLGAAFKWTSINKVVHVNNFIFSTNPYPSWSGEELDAIRKFISLHFPEHLIIFRSLNEKQNGTLLAATAGNSFINIVSRQVYLYEPDRKRWQKRNNNYQDGRIIKQAGLTLIGHEEMSVHLEEALLLYNKLYLDKYCIHNPQFTSKFFTECHKRNLIHFQGYLDKDGKLRAFSGLFVYGETITSPLVGYDTYAPSKDGLYIHAIRSIFDHMFNTQTLLNLSSGASQFKRLRGGLPHLEYSSIYYKHLSLKTRLMIRTLAFVSNKIGKPLLTKYEL